MSTRFIHARSYIHSGFSRPRVSATGGATIAYDVVCNADGSPEKVVYAVAMCARNDVYNKAKGRVVAEGRLLCKRGTQVHVLTYQPDVPVWVQVSKDAQSRYNEAGIEGVLPAYRKVS